MPTLISRLVPAVLAATLILAPRAAAKPLKHGSHGAAVKRLQRALHLTPDGVYGTGTLRTVRRFQRRHDLPADGIVGAATWRMVRRSRDDAPIPVVRSRGAVVRLLQRRLGIGTDGVFGPGTAGAVRSFQRGHGLTPDGIVGPGTWHALGVRGTHAVLKHPRPHRVARPHPSAALVARAIAAGNRIAALPYAYGGGHGSFHADGYDCSGSVSYVLHAIGRLDRPMDSSELMHYGSAGPGRLITVYANPGHAYMVIAGRRFDTSGRYATGSRWQPRARSAAGYVVRHPPGL